MLIIGLFGVILAAPVLQMKWRLVPEPKLVGFTSGSGLRPLTWHTWTSGAYQKRFDRWLQESIGFRAAGIRTDSQINLTLFNESAIKTADRPIVGKEGILYAQAYLEEYNRRNGSQAASAAEFARDLRRLQDGLQKRGKAFVFVIAPSKAEVYPEFIPSRFLSPTTRANKSAYQQLLPFLRKEGVHLVDGHSLFLEQKLREPWLLFPPGGIHWQAYGAWQVLERMTGELESQLGRPLARISCEGVAADAVSWRQGEADLAAVMNVWVPPRWSLRVPRPKLHADPGVAALRPSLLLVGDSFAEGLTALMNGYGTTDLLDYYYYFSKHRSYPSGKVMPLEKAKIDWERDVFGKDAVVIELNEILLNSKAWGFVEEALKHLDEGRAAE